MQKDFENDLTRCSVCLETSGIFLYPTDTIWGIGCDGRDEAAVQRIIQLKKRPSNKSFVILVADLDQLKKYVSHIDEQLLTYLNKVEKPTTGIYSGAKHLAPSVIAEDGTVAIRICKDPFCQALIKRSQRPLLSTSANISGEPAPGLFKQMNPLLLQAVDYVVKYRQEETKKSAPSAIIKWDAKSKSIEIIRP